MDLNELADFVYVQGMVAQKGSVTADTFLPSVGNLASSFQPGEAMSFQLL